MILSDSDPLPIKKVRAVFKRHSGEAYQMAKELWPLLGTDPARAMRYAKAQISMILSGARAGSRGKALLIANALRLRAAELLEEEQEKRGPGKPHKKS